MTTIGVPTEIKTDEYRVALTPSGVRELTDRGHSVCIQTGAGEGSAIPDEHYVAQGATVVPDADAVFAEAELIVKVKEPQPEEVARLQPRHTLRYRIRKVEELTGRDLGTARDRIEFWLALRGREIVRTPPRPTERHP